MSGLLTRDEFRESVFERDRHTCVICGAAAQDAHHIIERRLWSNGGYYLENGASLCATHHIQAETTELSVEEIREAAGITHIILPPDLHEGVTYTKWGDVVLPNGTRTRGPLFEDESVQKILRQGGMLTLYTEYIKYPTTPHLPWSPGVSPDDRKAPDISHLIGREVVVTEKMDGENTTIYPDYYHARSTASGYHPSRSWVGATQARIGHNLPDRWRVCGENLYARHSIGYDELKDYFQVFSIWDEQNFCLSWDETAEWCALLDLKHVLVIDRLVLRDERFLRDITDQIDTDVSEGIVVRLAGRFHYTEFEQYMAKWVRPNHVTTDEHWKHGPLVPNTLRT